MILAKLGYLSKEQDLVAGAVASTDQIIAKALEGIGPENICWVIDTETVHDANGASDTTYTFSLRVATSTALTTYKEVASVTITGATDLRLLTVGRHLVNLDVGTELMQAIRDFRSEQSLSDTDDIYIGWMSTLTDNSGDANISINGALSPTRPPTIANTIKTISNVGTPARASAGS